MAESYSVEAVLSARDDGFIAGMKAAEKSTKSIGEKLKNGISFGAFMAIGNKAVSSVTNSLGEMVGGLNESSAAWKTFQGNMEMNNHTKKEIAATKKELQGFAEQTIYSSSDMASTFAQLDAVGTKNTTNLVKGFGGLAAAAEKPQQAMKTLSQQATQMAAKPKIQWEDFKLMVEQTPAGIAAIAKEMGVSTQQMIKDVQDGKIKTEDFFDAISKVGTNKHFTKLATEYKTVGQAMDGMSETAVNKLQPAFDLVSGAAIKSVGKITDALGTIDGNSMAKKIASFGVKAGKYWNVLKSDAKEAGVAFGSAVGAIGRSMKKMNGSFGSAKSVNDFKGTLDTVTAGLKKFAGFCEDHSDAIAGLISSLPKLLVTYKGFKIVKATAPAVGTFTKSILSLGKKGISAIAGKLFGIAAGEQAAGKSAKISNKSMLAMAKSTMMMGTGVMTVAVGFGIMAAASIALANSGGLAIGVMLGMVGALVGLGIGMATLLKTLAPLSKKIMPVATAMLAMGAAVLLISTGFALLAFSAISLANAGTPAIAVIVGMVAAMVLLAAGAAALGPALTAGAVGFVAFGAAIALVGVGALLAATSIAILAAVLPTVVEYGLQGAVAIIALGAGMVVFAAGAGLAGVACTVLGAGLVVLGAGFLVAGAGAVVAGAGFVVLGAGMLSVSAAVAVVAAALGKLVEKISGGFAKVLGAIAKVIDSIGTSAKNAGTGFLSVAKGIKLISGLSLKSIAKSLGAVALGLGKISKKGPELSQAANGMKGISTAVRSAGTEFDTLGSKAQQSVAKVKTAMSQAESSAKSSGKKVGAGFVSSMQSGLSKAPSVASKGVSRVNAKLRSGHSEAQSAGRMISAGFASGMSSNLGQIEATASRMVSAADKAIRAKAKIHSPSRLTKSHGRNIAIGLGIGIRKGITYVKNASKSLISAASKTLKKASKTRQYEDLASSAVDQYKSSMESRVSKATKSMEKQVNTAVKKLQKKNPKLKKAYANAGKILKSDISKTIKAQGNKAINAADKALTALGKKYQEKYDAIISDRDSYISKLSDYGELFSSDDYGYVSLVDFKAQRKQAEQLAKNMERLKKVLPYDLMKDIQNLDTAQGLQYTNELLKKGDTWLKQYGKDYTAFISSANKNAKAYYQPYINSLDKDYNSAVTKELNKLKKQMNEIGKQATSGFVKGLTSKTNKKALKKAASDLSNILVKSVKGKLKIHSPSRVLRSLGVYAIKGFVNGMEGMSNSLRRTMDQMITIPNLDRLAIAGDVGGTLNSDYDYYSRAEYTVIVPLEINGKEFARATAKDMEEAQNKLQTRRSRKLGKR